MNTYTTLSERSRRLENALRPALPVAKEKGFRHIGEAVRGVVSDVAGKRRAKSDDAT